MFSNNYYNTDDFFGYHPPRAQHHFHEGSINRYLRMKEQEDREAAYAHRRQRELRERLLYDHRRQQALELRRQQAMAAQEEERRRFKQHQRFSWHQEHEEHEEDDEDKDYDIQIVRGRDGNLYYVKRQRPQRKQHRPTIIEENHVRSRQRPRPEIVEEEPETEDESEYDSDTDSGNDSSDFEQDFVPQNQRRIPSRKSTRKHRVTVIVEDASDSECENAFESPWRNRRPSPDESWMEPIEPYIG